MALADPAYVTALAGAAFAFVVRFEGPTWDRFFPYVDALALGCWAAVGTQKALLAGVGWLPALLLGVVTAVGGGVVRDVAIGRVPTVFGGNTLYATSALFASCAMVTFQMMNRDDVGLIVATSVGAGLCLVARRRSWMLPERIVWRRSRRRGP